MVSRKNIRKSNKPKHWNINEIAFGGIITPIIYISETWVWNERIPGVEINYLRKACSGRREMVEVLKLCITILVCLVKVKEWQEQIWHAKTVWPHRKNGRKWDDEGGCKSKIREC